MKKSYRPESLQEETGIINSYLYEGNQQHVSSKHKITRRVLKEVLLKHNIPLRSQPDSLRGKQLGSQNPNWKGGAADVALRKEFGGSWKRVLVLWSYLIQYADDSTCRKCGEEGEDPHHIIPIRAIYRNGLSRELVWSIENGIYLCKKCHMKTHMNEEIFEETFKKLIKNRLNSVESLQDIINTIVSKYRAKYLRQKIDKGVTTRP